MSAISSLVSRIAQLNSRTLHGDSTNCGGTELKGWRPNIAAISFPFIQRQMHPRNVLCNRQDTLILIALLQAQSAQSQPSMSSHPDCHIAPPSVTLTCLITCPCWGTQ
eukprot:4380422-Amphidinium_carterae.1